MGSITTMMQRREALKGLAFSGLGVVVGLNPNAPNQATNWLNTSEAHARKLELINEISVLPAHTLPEILAGIILRIEALEQ